MMVIGMGSAAASTKSPTVPGSMASNVSFVSTPTSCSRRATIFGVKAVDTSRRSLVWRGGSRPTIISPPRSVDRSICRRSSARRGSPVGSVISDPSSKGMDSVGRSP